MTEKLMEYFNKQPRLGTLSTADKSGKVNSAYFGSPRMIAENIIFMGIGKNRTLANLLENPNAVFLVMEPAEALPDCKGLRIYVKMTDHETSGENYEKIIAELTPRVGEETARKMIHAAVTFVVEEVRPLVDMGQGWEKSI
jgi:hypothetical protein